jgi:hypothetical protein
MSIGPALLSVARPADHRPHPGTGVPGALFDAHRDDPEFGYRLLGTWNAHCSIAPSRRGRGFCDSLTALSFPGATARRYDRSELTR